MIPRATYIAVLVRALRLELRLRAMAAERDYWKAKEEKRLTYHRAYQRAWRRRRAA